MVQTEDGLGSIESLRGVLMMDYGKLLWIGMVLAGALARLMPHPWNFTPMIAMGLFAGYRAGTARTGMVATLSALVVSDVFLGFYSGFWYVYGAMLLPVLMGRWLRSREGVEGGALGRAGEIATGAFASGMSFFVITNFMVWVMGRMYPHTMAGLAACFVAAIPFYGNQIVGDAFYTAVFFGGYAALSRLVLPMRQVA